MNSLDTTTIRALDAPSIMTLSPHNESFPLPDNNYDIIIPDAKLLKKNIDLNFDEIFIESFPQNSASPK